MEQFLGNLDDPRGKYVIISPELIFGRFGCSRIMEDRRTGIPPSNQSYLESIK